MRSLRSRSMKKNVNIAMAACVLHNWCIMADNTDVSQFREMDIDLNIDARLNMNLTAAAIGVPNSTSGNAKKALLVDRINRR